MDFPSFPSILFVCVFKLINQLGKTVIFDHVYTYDSVFTWLLMKCNVSVPSSTIQRTKFHQEITRNIYEIATRLRQISLRCDGRLGCTSVHPSCVTMEGWASGKSGKARKNLRQNAHKLKTCFSSWPNFVSRIR